MSQLHTTPASIAAALRRAADDIERMGDTELSPVNVHLSFQAVAFKGAFAERMAAVDALAVALTGNAGDTDEGDNAHHSLKSWTPRLGEHDMDVAVFTAVKDHHIGGAK